MIAAAALALAGCAPSGGDDASDTVLRIAQTGSADVDFTAGNRQNPELSLFAKAMYDSLFTSEDGGVNITPGLATEWSYDESRTTLTVKLREGVTFSDGSTFDAHDVQDTMEHFVKADVPPGWAARYERSEVVDDYTIVIHQKEAWGLFLVSLRNFAITSSEAITDPETMVTTPIGTGPYVLNRDESIEGTNFVFDKRDEAWEADTYPFDRLVFHLVGDDASAAVNALRAGQVDFVVGTDGSTADSLVADGYEALPYYSLYYGIALDTTGNTVPALADLRVRQAISYAFDREGISTAVNYGYGNPTSQIEANPDSAFYRPGRDDEYAYDIEKAKALLAEAGYPDGFDMDIVASVGLTAYRPVIEQAFADIGINLTYVEVQNDVSLDEYLSGRYSGLVTVSTPGEVTADFVPGYYVNPWAGNTTPELEEIIATINDGDAEEVEQASSDIGDFLLDNAWTVIFAHPGTVQISDPEVVAFRDFKSWIGQVPLRAMVPAE